MTSATLNLDSGLSAAVEAASRSKNRALEERVKVLIEEGTNRILGAQLLGRHAEEVINFFAMAIRFGLSPDQLKEMRYSYASHSDDVSCMV